MQARVLAVPEHVRQLEDALGATGDELLIASSAEVTSQRAPASRTRSATGSMCGSSPGCATASGVSTSRYPRAAKCARMAACAQ
jgi:hypothetical protein